MEWLLRTLVRRGGEVPFRDMMELALYHPRDGYYSTAVPRYGRDADYITAPTASPWYPAVMGRLVGRLAAASGPMVVADVAAGDGSLLAGLLAAAPGGSVRRGVAVERSAGLRRLQRARLRGAAAPVSVRRRVGAAPRPGGPALVHASELYDALPVHRVVRRAAGLRELWVGVAGGELEWREYPAPRSLAGYLGGHGVELAVGQVAELNLEAEPLHRELLRWAGAEGVAVVLDYGYPARRLYNPRGRGQGSLATYRKHHMGRNALERPGEQDLTAHVNWDDLRRAAEEEGWEEIGLWPLAELLVRGGLGELVEEAGLGVEADLDATTVTARQELKRLLDPEGMGTDLKVLVQAAPGAAAAAAREALALPGL